MSELSLVEPISLLTSVSDDCGLLCCLPFVYKRRADNSYASNSCLGLSLVEPMSLLDSVSDDCEIKNTKALSLFCVFVCNFHDMCMLLLLTSFF